MDREKGIFTVMLHCLRVNRLICQFVSQLVENCIGKGGNSRNNSLIYALGNLPIVFLYKYIMIVRLF